jgi:hypothetical protein
MAIQRHANDPLDDTKKHYELIREFRGSSDRQELAEKTSDGSDPFRLTCFRIGVIRCAPDLRYLASFVSPTNDPKD